MFGEVKKVLIVDDESFIRKLSQKILSRAGFETVLAEDGKSALDIYRQNQDNIGLVILDIRMPGMTGLEVYKEILKIKDDTRVILCSGFGEEEVPIILPDFFIQKPFAINDFMDSIQRVISAEKETILEINKYFKNGKNGKI